MKLITRDTDYAVRALTLIARDKDKLATARALAEKSKIPRPFLRKILQELNKKGLLKSHKGISGGFFLAKPAEKISLVDLIKIFQGKFSINECFFKKLPCPSRGKCLLNREIRAIEQYALSRLRKLSIAALLKGR
ncbi:MAG: Rrf2 family transcriptional regulator [Candidatus Omnitrophota bacterium]